MPSELEIINKLGGFSKRNMRFINEAKRLGVFESNKKTVGKNLVEVARDDSVCHVLYDYGKMNVKLRWENKAGKELCAEVSKLA